MAEPQLPNGESNGAAPDGVASNGANNFALTAYSSQPTPPSEGGKPKAKVPKDFLLPDGTPDVSTDSRESTPWMTLFWGFSAQHDQVLLGVVDEPQGTVVVSGAVAKPSC